MSDRPQPRHRRRLVLLALAVTGLVGTAGPAGAHPLGTPPEVTLGVESGQVVVTWRAARDDVFALALRVGAIAGELVFEEVDGRVVQVAGERDDVLLAEDPAVPAYLLDTVQVAQGGRSCPGEVVARPTYEGDPARLAFDCPDPGAAVDLTVTTLQDVDARYRTLVRADGAEPARGVHTADAPTTAYALPSDERPAAAGTSSAGLVAVVAAAALLCAGGLVAIGRRSRARAAG